MQTGTATENGLVVPQNIKNRVTIKPSNSSPGYLPEKLGNIYSQRYIHPCVQCSIIHGGQDMETIKVSFDRGVGKGEVAEYTMEHYSAIRKDKMLPLATTWMDLENIM